MQERRRQMWQDLLGEKYDSPGPEGSEPIDIHTQSLVEIEKKKRAAEEAAAAAAKLNKLKPAPSTSSTSVPRKSVRTENFIKQKSLQFDDIIQTSKLVEDDLEPEPARNKTTPEAHPSPDTSTNVVNSNRLGNFIKKSVEVKKVNSQKSISDNGQEEEEKQEEEPPIEEAKADKPVVNSDALVNSEFMVGWQDLAEARKRKESGSMRHLGVPVFFITQVDSDHRDQLVEDILLLGGQVHEEEFMNGSISHLICAAPNRGQKYLSGLAAGIFILHASYVEDSMKAGYFLDEHPYEFGNPACSRDSHVLPKDKELVHAAYRWRLKIAQEEKFKNGAFSGFKVLLICNKDKIRQFAAVVKSGGGEYFDAQPPFSRRAITGYGITHCFIETKIKLSPTDADVLKRAKIPIVLMMYFNIYLLSETIPDISKCYYMTTN